MLYGKPTKHIRHADESTLTIEPQRFQIFRFWKYDDTGTVRTDGLDLKDEKVVPLGSRITKHKVDVRLSPETIEPQEIYIGRIKLSFSDVMNHAICGGRFEQASHADTATENFAVKTTPVSPQMWPDQSATDAVTRAMATEETDLEIAGSGSGFGIQEWKLDDHIKHWINLKRFYVMDQRPIVGSRWQRVPSKVKRINEGTYYGLLIFNDSPRGATPADTQIKLNIKSYWEETAI